jgi:predicted RNase H-like nuclease (RuvC/YqgF family)
VVSDLGVDVAMAKAPALKGKGGLALRLEGDSVVLLSEEEERRIPLPAVEGVSAEGRTVEVELLGGDVPVVYRVEEVPERAAEAFAEEVSALLPVRDLDVSPVDGPSMVTVVRLTQADRRRTAWRGAVSAVTGAFGG